MQERMNSPVVGSVYWVMLWWLASSISSIRTPVWRRNSIAAQPQNAQFSSRVRLRRTPASSKAQVAPSLSGWPGHLTHGLGAEEQVVACPGRIA